MAITVTIAKHSVAQLASGLSPLQEQLLDNAAPIRIVDAPTGAGKTYAFQQGLITRQQRILFIVPTRRLAQNIAGGLINDLVQQENWTAQLAESKVAIWSSDESTRLRETQGIENIRGFRVRQWQALNTTRPEGEMIVAIPEVVSHLLVTRKLDLGHASMGVFDLLDAFDHIVFDEFHTIESRGFGLAALLAKLAPYFGRAKVSLLSATPIDVQPTLLKLGVEASHIKELSESLVEKGRPLHGDVKLCFSDCPDMKALLQAQIQLIQAEVQSKRQVVVIYNALSDLKRDLNPLATVFKSVNIPLDQVLVINSIDDSGGNHILNCGFHVGQKRNPDDFSIILATASVEIGVTFREANIMLMESGFEPMNFLQRYGRAARKGKDGQVFVRADNDALLRNPWLREIKDWIKNNGDTLQNIQALTQVVSQSIETLNHDPNSERYYFGELAKHAEYCSGLYWQLLMNHPSNKGYRKRHLLDYQPASSKTIYALIRTIRQFEFEEDYSDYCKTWLKHFYGQALQYRDIGQRVRVIEGSGKVLNVSQLWLERETDLLNYWQEDDDGHVFCEISGELEDYLLDIDAKNQASRQVDTYFPHSPEVIEFKVDASLVNHWCRSLMDRRNRDTDYAMEDYPEAMKATEKLVRLTNLLASKDSALSDAAMIGVY